MLLALVVGFFSRVFFRILIFLCHVQNNCKSLFSGRPNVAVLWTTCCWVLSISGLWFLSSTTRYKWVTDIDSVVFVVGRVSWFDCIDLSLSSGLWNIWATVCKSVIYKLRNIDRESCTVATVILSLVQHDTIRQYLTCAQKLATSQLSHGKIQ